MLWCALNPWKFEAVPQSQIRFCCLIFSGIISLKFVLFPFLLISIFTFYGTAVYITPKVKCEIVKCTFLLGSFLSFTFTWSHVFLGGLSTKSLQTPFFHIDFLHSVISLLHLKFILFIPCDRV